MAPPFAFNDVTMSVFPLRASLPRLDAFCRNHLNQAPHLVQFRPFMPFVYLVILDYGRMSLEAANMGWVSQREVAFGVPLRWLNADGDGFAFHDWAFTTPYIFVDNEMSMSTGREVYGWPKLLAKLDPTVSEWVRDPHGSRRVFQVSTKRAANAYEGEHQEFRPFLSVHQHRSAGVFDIPPNLETMVKPVLQFPNAAAGATRLGIDLVRTFAGMASDGITGSPVLPNLLDLDTFKELFTGDKLKTWAELKRWKPGLKNILWSLFPRTCANTINFKQFRDAGNPHAPCYQAITAAKMPIKSIKRGGFLGPSNMVLGQMDGGFRIDIHHLAGLPVVESLGLEIAAERNGDDTLVSSLSPVCPFWVQVDMTYGLADTLAWRGRQGAWQLDRDIAHTLGDSQPKTPESEPSDGTLSASVSEGSEQSEAQYPAEERPDLALDDETDDTFDLHYLKAMNFFNTARGATEALGGAFSMPNASIRVLPLKADFKTLQTFVSNYLQVENHVRFDAWGDFVYAVVCDFDQMNSELNAIAKRRAREVNLVVPVKCYSWFDDPKGSIPKTKPNQRIERGENHLITTGFVSVFSYADDAGTAITASEVAGIPTMAAHVISPESDWLSLDPSQDRAQRDVLDVRAQVLPALMSGAEACERSLVELHNHAPPHDLARGSRPESVNNWVSLLAEDLDTKQNEKDAASVGGADPFATGLGFALKLLGGDQTFNQYSLKQFRDSKRTLEACYQGLVMRRHHIRKLHDFREIEDSLHVSITDYPTQPITEILGLIPKFSLPGDGRTIRVFEALRPISIRADLYREAGNTLFERLGDGRWQKIDSVEEIFGWRHAGPDEANALIERADSIDGKHPVDLQYWCKMPNKDDAFFVQKQKATKGFITTRFSNHLEKGKVSELMIRDRYHSDRVSVLTNRDLLDPVSGDSTIDIAAFNSQVAVDGHETTFKQSDVAAGLESFSPATILDAVLSRQWGLGLGCKRRSYDKPDFCVSYETIPSEFVDALFPNPELLHNFWPQTEDFFDDQIRRRNGEVLGIRSEFTTMIELLGSMVERLLDSRSTDAADRMFENLLKGMQKALTPKEKTVFNREIRAIESGEAQSDERPNLLRIFIDAMLPNVFKLKDHHSVRGALPEVILKRHSMVSSEDWQALEEAQSRFYDFLIDFFKDDERFKCIIEEASVLLTPRIEKNRCEMELVEKAHMGEGDLEDFYMQNPHEILRKRLLKLFSGGKLQ